MESFLEELIVRRELSDNYCHYEANYDNLRGAAQWAQDTLAAHAGDKRDYLYTRCGWMDGWMGGWWMAAQFERLASPCASPCASPFG